MIETHAHDPEVPEHAVSPAARWRTSYHDDLVPVGIGLWLTVACSSVAWAPDARSNTFKSWHAVFYSGFLGCAAWLGLSAVGAPQAGGRS